MSCPFSHLALLSDGRSDFENGVRADDETVQITLVSEVIRRVSKTPPRARFMDARRF